MSKIYTPQAIVERAPDSEEAHQTAFFCWAYQQTDGPLAPLSTGVLFAVPNGGKRSAAAAGRLKAQGVKSGVLDVILLWPSASGSFAGLCIEFKRPSRRNHKYGGLSVAQRGFMRDLPSCYSRVVVYTYEEAISTVKGYLGVEE